MSTETPGSFEVPEERSKRDAIRDCPTCKASVTSTALVSVHCPRCKSARQGCVACRRGYLCKKCIEAQEYAERVRGQYFLRVPEPGRDRLIGFDPGKQRKDSPWGEHVTFHFLDSRHEIGAESKLLPFIPKGRP